MEGAARNGPPASAGPGAAAPPMAGLRPSTSGEVQAAIEWALAAETPLEIVGHGSKRGIGRPVETDRVLDLSRLSGVTLYEPEELVLSARAGTPLNDFEIPAMRRIGSVMVCFLRQLARRGGEDRAAGRANPPRRE